MKLARERLEEAEMLVFDIWAAIPYSNDTYNTVDKHELIDNIVRSAWSMSKSGERHAIGLLGNLDPQHKLVHDALQKFDFAIHSLETLNSPDEGAYFDDVMSTLIKNFANKTQKEGIIGQPKGLTLYSGGHPDMRPSMHVAIRSAMNKDVHVIFVSWHGNLHDFYRNMAFHDEHDGEMRIRLLDDILLCQESSSHPYW